MRILVINGPNLDRLGVREPELYGHETLAALNARIAQEAQRLGVEVEFLQTNHEGVIVEAIGGASARFDGIIVNPGAYSHYSLAIRDALAGAGVVSVEVHLTNLFRRESFRQRLVTAGA
ncbi:MAG: type II 3-dehydroquinate dehydratase, partial [Bacillota bacterium]